MVSWHVIAGRQRWTAHCSWIVLVLGIALSLLAAWYLSVQILNEARTSFERATREIHRSIAGRLTSYTGLLWGLRGLYQAADDVSRSEFRDYVGSLDLSRRNPAVSSVNFAERVNHGSIAAFERRVRDDRSVEAGGYAGFRVFPARFRDEMHVLTYLEPFEKTRSAFGMDLNQSPFARFDELKRTGDFISSGEVVAHQKGLPLALRLAIYRRGMPLETADHREAAFIGSVGMGFSLLQLMEEAVPAEMLSLMRIRIHNIGRSNDLAGLKPPGQGSLLIDTSASFLPMARDLSLLEHLGTRTRLDFGGAMLELSFESPLDAFSPPNSRLVPAAVLAAGIAASVLLALLLGLLLGSRRRLEVAAGARNAALHVANAALEREIKERDRLEREVIHALTEERRHFAQELHDNLGQQLTAAGFLIEALKNELEAEGLPVETAIAGSIAAHISEVIARARQLSHRLNPVEAGRGALAHALMGLADETGSRAGIGCRFESPACDVRKDMGGEDQNLEHHLFRLAQEAVAGALDRGAVRIGIRLDRSPLTVSITDNGRPAGEDADVCLRIMAFRCRALGLDLRVEPVSGELTRVVISVPMPACVDIVR